MSAFVVTKTHIDALVSAAVQYGGLQTGGPADALGWMLWDENHTAASTTATARTSPPRSTGQR